MGKNKTDNLNSYVKKIVPFLNTVKDVKKSNRAVLMQHLSEDSCNLLFDTIRNIIKSDTVSPTQKKLLKRKLGRHKSLLRYLSDPSKPINTRRRRMIQSGKGLPFLGTILSTAIPLLLSLITKK